MKSRKINREEFGIVVSDHQLKVMRLSHGREKTSERPLLVFLHEALGCSEMWQDFPEKIAFDTGCDVLAYDRLGHGYSDILPLSEFHEDYLFDEAWKMLPRVLSACGTSSVILIGHSDGGTIALLFAAKYPDVVKGVITEAAHVFVDALTTEGIKQTVKAYESTNLKERLERYHGKNTQRIFDRWSSIWLSRDFASWNVESFLPDINAPVLGIQGREDVYGKKEQVESIVSNSGGYSQKLFIPDCGHIPHKEAPDIVRKGISDFILNYCI